MWLCDVCHGVNSPTPVNSVSYQSHSELFDAGKIVECTACALLLPLFVSSFTVFKAAIPSIHPFAWDSELAAWDMALHGGVHPWVWLQYVLDYPLITSAINFIYHLWFFILYGVIYLITVCMSKPLLRMQFLLSFVISWILLGNVVATLFSSVGPCYYGHLQLGADPYASLMKYLNESSQHAPVWALGVQKMLWEAYQDKSKISELSISALPSMHVATAVLMALLGWGIHRAAGIALSIFAVLIMIGSVHLGWHYALDGYVGAAGAYAIWRVVGWALQSSNQTVSEKSFSNPQMPSLV
jgi:PAP2 superfamily